MSLKEKLLAKLKSFNPRFFNQSALEALLKNSENKIILTLRTDPNHVAAYKKFDETYSAYLSKIPQSTMKTYVSALFNKKLVFFGVSQNKEGNIFSRALITKTDKLAGIVVNAYAIDISLVTGETSSIDEAIHATYSGLVRSAAILNKVQIKKDYELHKYLTNYIYMFFLKLLGKHFSMTNNIQKSILHIICIYLFYKQFMEEKHSGAIKTIEKYYLDGKFGVNKEDYNQIKDRFEKIQSFDSFKEFPRVSEELNLTTLNTQQMTMFMIKTLDKAGFYSLCGSLDMFLMLPILSKYPTELISRNLLVNSHLQDQIENKLESYLKSVEFDDSFLRLSEKMSEKSKEE